MKQAGVKTNLPIVTVFYFVPYMFIMCTCVDACRNKYTSMREEHE